MNSRYRILDKTKMRCLFAENISQLQKTLARLAKTTHHDWGQTRTNYT